MDCAALAQAGLSAAVGAKVTIRSAAGPATVKSSEVYVWEGAPFMRR